jgi:hypothetical protein
MEEMKKLTRLILSINYNDSFVDIIHTAIQSFQSKNYSSISNYDNWIVNCEKEKYLKKPEFKIYEIKNRNAPSSVVANVKWKFLYEGKFLKNKATILYLGNKTKYPDIESNLKLIKKVEDLIKNHFNEKSPLSTVDIVDLKLMKEEVELFYYWKNKLIELEYRLSPKYYLSQSNNDKPEQIIINIKWGFQLIGKSTIPRYILKRYSVDKRFINNLDAPDLDYELQQIVKEHISKVCPVFFDPQHKK